jgi:single-stranded DNA-binding protein
MDDWTDADNGTSAGREDMVTAEIALVGVVTAAPLESLGTDGLYGATFELDVTERSYRSDRREWEVSTNVYGISAYDDLAAAVMRTVRVGDQLVVVGFVVEDDGVDGRSTNRTVRARGIGYDIRPRAR